MSLEVRLAVLGDPLDYTRSPDLHRAGLAALGLAGDSRALRTPESELGARLSALAAEGLTGVNLTHPLKGPAMSHLSRIGETARRARSVNTVGFDRHGGWGETTDGPGFLDLLRALSRDPANQRVVLLGAGGAARSLVVALSEAGAPPPRVSARRMEVADAALEGTGARLVAWRSAEERSELARATLIVNATPLTDPEQIAAPDSIGRGSLIIDLRYGEALTPWVSESRRIGREAFDGLGLLVFQARRSLELWLAREVPLEPLAAAVGWPR